MAVICCWRCGTVSVERSEIEGSIVLAKGPASRLERVLSAIARHAYDGRTLLVPGVPEADSDDAALKAVAAFQTELEKRFSRKGIQ